MSNRSEAEESLATAQQAAQEARAAYETAVSAGDMETAAEAQKAARVADAEAQRWGDRLAVIDAEKAEADQRRADKRLAESVAAAEKAAEAESEAHRELIEAVATLKAVRQKLDVVHSEASTAVMAVNRAAADADRPAPRVDRSDLHRLSEPRKLLALAKEIASVSNFQSGQVTRLGSRRKAG